MKRYRVRLTKEAELDLIDIYHYVAQHDTSEAAHKLLSEIENICLALSTMPDRGHIPPELDRVAVTSYREVFFQSYRIIYELIGREVFIHGVLDGRREMSSLLERRLLR